MYNNSKAEESQVKQGVPILLIHFYDFCAQQIAREVVCLCVSPLVKAFEKSA